MDTAYSQIPEKAEVELKEDQSEDAQEVLENPEEQGKIPYFEKLPMGIKNQAPNMELT